MKFGIVLSVVVLLIAGLVTWIIYNQERLIFPGFTPNSKAYDLNRDFSLKLTVESEIELNGWRFSGADENSQQVLIYFGGNAQDVTAMKPLLQQLPVKRIYTFNYRGYGGNPGEPSEAGFYQDAIQIYDRVVRENPEAKITIAGFSMGSAVAGYVAANKPIEKLVLICPLKSIEQIVTDKFSPVIGNLVRHKFDLHTTAAAITVPTMVFIASSDKTIPPTHSKATYDALKREKSLVIIGGASHNSIFENDGFWEEFAKFMPLS